MTDERKWLLRPLDSKIKVAELWDLVDNIPPKYVASHDGLKTKADLILHLQACRRRYWNDRQQPKSDQPPKRPTDLCQITAADANAWLQSLPPMEDGDTL